MLPFLRLPVLATLAASLCLPAFAQQAGRQISFRTLCLGYQNDINRVRMPDGKGDKAIDVALYTGGFSELYKARFTGKEAVIFIQDADAPDGRLVVGRGPLASGAQQLFLVLPDPAPDAPVPYRIHAMNDDEKSFPMGGVRLLNLYQGQVRLNLAGASMPPIDAGKLATYPQVNAVDEWNMYQARIEFGTPDGQWVPVSSPSWKSTKLKRDLIVTSIDPRTRQPRISTFKDIPPWREEGGEE